MTTYTLDDVAAGRSERADAPEPRTIDPNAWQEAAERVAQWHIDNCTPEFVEWLDDSYAAGRIEMQTIAAILCALPREAHLVQQAKGLADTILGDFRTFVANADERDWWLVARQMAREVRRESGLPDGDDYDDGSNDEDNCAGMGERDVDDPMPKVAECPACREADATEAA